MPWIQTNDSNNMMDDYDFLDQLDELEHIHAEIKRMDEISRAAHFRLKNPEKVKAWNKRWYNANGKEFWKEYNKKRKK